MFVLTSDGAMIEKALQYARRGSILTRSAMLLAPPAYVTGTLDHSARRAMRLDVTYINTVPDENMEK